METAAPLSGRRAQAARNDQLILEAARAVFTRDPGAPIAAVAERAGVGISALYRRYASKDELLQRLATDGLDRYLAAAETALADDGDPWSVFTRFLHAALDAGAGSLTARLAGSYTVTDELRNRGQRAGDLTGRLLARVREAGALRGDVDVSDISLMLELVQMLNIRDPARLAQLKHRYLTVLLDGLHTPAPTALPGPPPTWPELTERYESS